MHDTKRELSMKDVFHILISRKLFILVSSLMIGLTCFALSFLLPERYRAQSKVIPAGILSGRSQMSNSGLLDAARSMGFTVGDSEVDPSALIPEFLDSDDFARALLMLVVADSKNDSIALLDRFSNNQDSSRREFEASEVLRRKVLDSSYDVKSRVTTIYVSTSDPRLSANIAWRCVELLNQFNLDIRINQATKEEEFIAGRLASIKHELEFAEQQLASFRATNRNTMDSPQLQVMEGRFKREAQAQQELFLLLQRQNELVGIEKVRSVPLLRMIEVPRPPCERNSPKRSLIVIGGVLFGLFAAMLWVLLSSVDRAQIATNGRTGPG